MKLEALRLTFLALFACGIGAAGTVQINLTAIPDGNPAVVSVGQVFSVYLDVINNSGGPIFFFGEADTVTCQFSPCPSADFINYPDTLLDNWDVFSQGTSNGIANGQEVDALLFQLQWNQSSQPGDLNLVMIDSVAFCGGSGQLCPLGLKGFPAEPYFTSQTFSVQVEAPEPRTFLFVGGGLLIVIGWRRKSS